MEQKTPLKQNVHLGDLYMDKAITNIPKIIKLVSQKIECNLIEQKDKEEVIEQVENLEEYTRRLRDLFIKSMYISTQSDCMEITSELCTNLITITGDLQNILEVTVAACQKYEKGFLQNHE